MKMKLVRIIKSWFSVIAAPKEHFQTIEKRSFETIVSEYLLLLLLVGASAGIYYFLISMIRAVYYQVILDASVNYLRMIQYTFGGSTSIFFFYFFVGTFLLFFLSIPLKLFFRRMKYTKLFSIMMYALAPTLLFGWLIAAIPALLIWSCILLIFALLQQPNDTRIKGSIRER